MQEPQLQLIVRDQFNRELEVTAKLYHPLSDVAKSLASSQPEQQDQEATSVDVDFYSLTQTTQLSLQSSPAACNLKDGDTLFCYKYREACQQHWQQQGKPERSEKLQFVSLYISDWACKYHSRVVFRHDLSTPFSVVLSAYCMWRGLSMDAACFLWAQFYQRITPADTGLPKGMDDGDILYLYEREVSTMPECA